MKSNDIEKKISIEDVEHIKEFIHRRPNANFKQTKSYKRIWEKVFGDREKKQEAWKVSLLDLVIVKMIYELEIISFETRYFKNSECYGF